MGYKSRKVEKEVVKKKEQGKNDPNLPSNVSRSQRHHEASGKTPSYNTFKI